MVESSFCLNFSDLSAFPKESGCFNLKKSSHGNMQASCAIIRYWTCAYAIQVNLVLHTGVTQISLVLRAPAVLSSLSDL